MVAGWYARIFNPRFGRESRIMSVETFRVECGS